MAGVAVNTVVKLLRDIGCACTEYQDKTLRNLKAKRVQCDEIWSFCYAKAANVPKAKQGKFGFGDVWTWVAIDADTKLVPCWLVGLRDSGYATEFIRNLASRLSNRVQLTTDGHKAYVVAIEDSFAGEGIDFAQLVKLYGPDQSSEIRYSPPQCVGCRKSKKIGNPDPKHISTSFAERQNLTMRMGMRRFTRLTNAFSKKVENLAHAVALHFMFYNFARVHQSIRVTPAMEAGVSDHVWEIEEIIALLEKSN